MNGLWPKLAAGDNTKRYMMSLDSPRMAVFSTL
jgi:hypothetical protein